MILAVSRYVVALSLILLGVSGASGQSPAMTIDQVVARFLERNLAVQAARHRVDIARGSRCRPAPPHSDTYAERREC
jgi:hypothetical protein